VPDVGTYVLVRGSVYTKDKYQSDTRQLAVTAIRQFPSEPDEIELVRADRIMMRERYGLK